VKGQLTIFFASDIHGSERVFRKFLNAAPHYRADALIFGGDITGKALVPVGGGEGCAVGTLERRTLPDQLTALRIARIPNSRPAAT